MPRRRRQLIITNNAVRKTGKIRRGKIIGIERIKHLIREFDDEYPEFPEEGAKKTAIPFIFQRTKCYILINADQETITVITVSCSQKFAESVRHTTFKY